MSQPEFNGLSNEALARVWFALGLAETRHPSEFTNLLDAAFAELNERLDAGQLAAFLDGQLARYRRAEAEAADPAGRASPSAAADRAHVVRDTYPA